MAVSKIKHGMAIAAIVLLSACGHAGNTLPATGSGTGTQSATRGTFRITVPAKPKSSASSKRPSYVSWSTRSVSLTYTIGSTTYPTQTVNVGTWDSQNCTSDQNSNLTCTMAFDAVPGNATYTVNAYDGDNGTGKLLSTASSSMQIVAGADNVLKVTLDGVVGGFNVTFTTPNNNGRTIPAGTAADVPVSVGATDPDGELILNSPQLLFPDGSALTSATLTITGDPAEFTLEQNGVALTPTSGSTYTIAAPFSKLSLRYNGGMYASLSITVGAGTASGQGELDVQPVITEFAPPVGTTLYSVGQMTAGPDGNVWFTECEQSGSNGVGKITPTGAITQYPLQGNAIPCGITSANGNLWISEDGNCPGLCGIQEMATDGTVLSRVDVYHGSCDPYPGEMATDINGNVWYDNSACGVIGYLPASNQTTEQHFFAGSDGVIAAGADGNVWFVANDANYTFTLGKISTAGTVQTYDILQNGVGSPPGSLAARPSDKSMWVAHQGDSLDTVSASGTLTNVPDAGATNTMLATGNDGNVYALSLPDSMGLELDSVAADGTVRRTYFYGAPEFDVQLGHFIAGPPGSNTLWFYDPGNAKIARITLGAAAL